MIEEQGNEKDSQPTADQVDFDPFAHGEVLQRVPTTEPQREIWTATRMDSSASCAFNAPLLLRLKGNLQYAALQKAYSQLISRHDALRGSFSPDGSEFIVAEHNNLSLRLVDLTDCAASAIDMKVADVIAAETANAFDLEFGPLIRGQLLQFSAADNYLLITVHHIICDGWSTGVLLHELAELYSAEVDSRVPVLQPAPSFVDYASRLHHEINSEACQDSKKYWQAQYAGEVPVLDLPTDRTRPAVRTFNASRCDYVIGQDTTGAIKSVASKTGNTLFTTLFAVFQILLWKRTGQQDIVVGFPAAAQPTTDSPGLVGHCVNLLPIRSYIDGQSSFFDHAQTLRPHIYDALEHQNVTFGSLLRELPIVRDASRIPMVPVIFNLEVYTNEFEFKGLDSEFSSRERSSENFEIFLNIVSHTDKLELQCSYNTDLFSGGLVKKMMDEYQVLMQSIATKYDQPLDSLAIVSNEDAALFERWRQQAIFDGGRSTVHQMFEQAADRYADKTAVICGEQSITYQHLDERANQLAQLLVAKGVNSGDFVGLYINRSVDMLVALLGILKAGAAYVPLDPGYPRERIDYIRSTASIKCFVTETLLGDDLTFEADAIKICIDDDTAFQDITSSRPALESDPDALAYVIFTSGSTGKPKGVQVPHRCVANLLAYTRELFEFTDADVSLAVSTLCFDISVPELLLPVVSGGKLIIARQDEVADGAALLQLLNAHAVSFLDATPSTWRLLLAAGWQSSPALTAISTGEAMPQDLVGELLPRAGQVWNMYGPTETTVWSSCYRITEVGQPILIGKPLGNTQCYVLDAAGQVLPVGVPGELYIGGDGVTSGYLNRGDLTAERFLDDPFSAEPGRRLYRTGDLVRWLDNGNLEYLHRIDHQVKIRGYRIELEEIEAVLASHPAVAQCVVEVREYRPGDQRLVAYMVFTADGELTSTEMRRHARVQLPDYMVPQHLVELDALPLTPNGKVDRSSLPAIALKYAGQPEPVAVQTEAERYLAALWQAELGEANIGAHDNFFDLGGHSLLAAQMVLRIRKERGCDIPLRAMIVNSLAQISAEYLEKQGTPHATEQEEKGASNGDVNNSAFAKIKSALFKRG